MRKTVAISLTKGEKLRVKAETEEIPRLPHLQGTRANRTDRLHQVPQEEPTEELRRRVHRLSRERTDKYKHQRTDFSVLFSLFNCQRQNEKDKHTFRRLSFLFRCC